MPAPGVEGFFSQIAAAIHHALHLLSTLLERMGITCSYLEDADIALWALVAWLLGSRESEALRKLGFIVAVLLAALAAVEHVLCMG